MCENELTLKNENECSIRLKIFLSISTSVWIGLLNWNRFLLTIQWKTWMRKIEWNLSLIPCHSIHCSQWILWKCFNWTVITHINNQEQWDERANKTEWENEIEKEHTFWPGQNWKENPIQISPYTHFEVVNDQFDFCGTCCDEWLKVFYCGKCVCMTKRIPNAAMKIVTYYEITRNHISFWAIRVQTHKGTNIHKPW